MSKQINQQEFITLASTLTRNQLAKHFGIADMTAQRIASELKVEFKKFVPKPTGRKRIKLI